MSREMSGTSAVPPKVVILGAGYAGALIARSLEDDSRKGRITVTVIERRDAVHHKIGAIRASVRGGEWTDRVRIPLNRVIKHAKTVIGNAVEVNEEAKEVRFSGGQAPVKYDILICATGTLNHSPGDLPNEVCTKDEVRNYFRSTSNAIKEAKDVVIVGGGASAVEYAGEIRDAYPDKKITILCSASNLLSSSVAPMSPKFLKQLYATMEARNIVLVRGEKVVKPSDIDFGQKKYERGPMTLRTVGEKNLELTTDLLLWAATWSVNASIYPADWLNEMGEVNISNTFNLVDHADVFAIGDVAGLSETKQAITLPPKMALIRTNVIKVADAMRKNAFNPQMTAKELGLKTYKVTDKVTMFLPVGAKFGVTQIGSYVYGDKATAKYKGVDLYTNLFWKLLTGTKAPTLVEA